MQNKLNIYNQNSRHNAYVTLAVLALVGLLGVVIFDLVTNVFGPSSLLTTKPNTEIVYRHPAMYTGADMSFQRPAYSGPSVKSSGASSSVAASPVVASPVAPSVSTSSPSMSARVRTTPLSRLILMVAERRLRETARLRSMWRRWRLRHPPFRWRRCLRI